MKNPITFLFAYTLLFFQFIFSSANAQEAKLVKQSEWGAGFYEKVVALNDLYYVATDKGQIDIFDPSKTGAEALVGQIKVSDKIYSFGTHNNRLLIASRYKLTIYDVTNTTELTINYSIDIHNTSFPRQSRSYDYKLAINDKIYFLDDNNDIYVISENNGTYRLENSIIPPYSPPTNSYVFVDEEHFYFVVDYFSSEKNDQVYRIEQYRVSDNSIITSVETEGLGDNKWILLTDEARFIIATQSSFQLIEIENDNINLLSNSPNTHYSSNNTIAYKKGAFYVRTGWFLRFYTIEDDNQIILHEDIDLKDYKDTISWHHQIDQLIWVNDSLISVSKDFGLVEVALSNNEVDNLRMFYNQTGRIGKGFQQGDFYFLPRNYGIEGLGIDVLNVSDKNNIVLRRRVNGNHNHYLSHLDGFISLTWYGLSIGDVIYDIYPNHQLIVPIVGNTKGYIKNEQYFYSGSPGNVQRHGISIPSSLHDIMTLQMPEGSHCPSNMSFMHDKLAAYDQCAEELKFFDNIDNDNFSLALQIKIPTGHRVAEFSNGMIYFVTPDTLATYSLTNGNELVIVNTQSMNWHNANDVKLEVVDNYLFATDQGTINFFDITIASSPNFLSTYDVFRDEDADIEYQFLDDTLLVSTDSNIHFLYINKAPTASIEQFTLDEDTLPEPLFIFTDPESDSMTFTITQAATNGEVTVDELGLVYTPNANFNGDDSVIVKAEDIHGNFIEHEVSITVEPVNDAPSITTTNLTTDEDVELVVQIEAEDVDGDDLQFTLGVNPSHAAVSLSETGEITIQPDANFNGTDELEVSITDIHGASITAVIEMTITPVNDSPVLSENSFSTDEDILLSASLVASDIDGDTLSYTLDSTVTSGVLTLEETGDFSYQPNADFAGSDSFTISITDEEVTIQEVITIDVNSINDAPIIITETIVTDEDTTYIGQIEASDVEADSLTFAIVTPTMSGTATITQNGELAYVPLDNFNGNDSVSISVTDIHGASITAVIEMTITPVNDPPVLSENSFNTDEDILLNASLVASDIDGDTLSYTLHSTTTSGVLTLEETGTFSYQPNADFDLEDSFEVRISDNQGGNSVAVIIIDITPVNDEPVLGQNVFSMDEDGELSNNIVYSDIDSNDHDFEIIETPEHGTVSLNKGQFTYLPEQNYQGADEFIIKITDDESLSVEGKVTIHINEINDAPELINSAFSLEEDNVLNTTIETSDIENHTVTVEILDKSSVSGELTLNSDGELSYTPIEHYNGDDSFQVRLTDSEGASSEHYITLTVTPVDDVPVVNDESFTLAFGTNHSGILPATDIDEEALIYTVITDVSHGTLTLSASGEYSYNPSTSFSGSDSFTYDVSDEVSTVQGTINFTVQAKPPEPKEPSSGGGSINFVLVILLFLNICYRCKEQAKFK